jgi:hypothetical protein
MEATSLGSRACKYERETKDGRMRLTIILGTVDGRAIFAVDKSVS